MTLRGQIPDAQSTFEDPIAGINLHEAEEDLKAGESSEMQNMVYLGGTVNRTGSNRITGLGVPSGTPASFAVRGGHRHYYGQATPTKVRLIVYDTNLSSISDAGAEAKLWTTLTTDKDTEMTTWPFSDSVYIANGSNALLEYNGTFVGPPGSIDLTDGVTFQWTLLGVEFYCELLGGGDPAALISDPTATGGLFIDGILATAGTKGSLDHATLNQWTWDDTGAGFNSIIVSLVDDSDPDTQAVGHILLQNSQGVPGLPTTAEPAPAVTGQVIGLVDRLFAVTGKGIERTNPRDASKWSVDSTWATFRPSQTGTFIAHIPHTVQGDEGAPINGALAMTQSSYYFYTGTLFGVDVTTATDTGTPADNSSIKYIDSIGAFGPKSMTTVPGVGTFWLTTDRNIYFVPVGRTGGSMVGNRIFNTGSTATVGLESLNIVAGTNAWMIYREPYLMLGIPVADATIPTHQYWMDMRRFRRNFQDTIWYGPMVGQAIQSVWLENQQGDDAIVGGEGDAAVGVFVYTLRVDNLYTDAEGTANNDISCRYTTYLKSGGAPSREKLVQQAEVEMNNISGSVTCDVGDISGIILADVPLEKTFT